MRSAVAQELVLDTLRYSKVWEDHLLLEAGLSITPDDDVLSIGSAGDNAMALLLAGARTVTTIDMSPTQSALIALKIAALHALAPAEIASLIGARAEHDRAALYARIAGDLPEAARLWWDAHQDDLAAGILGSGRLERYFAAFRDQHLARLHAPETVEALFTARDASAQRAAFARLATPEFEAAFRAYFDRDSMAKRGRDPAQFKYVEEVDVGGAFWRRFSYACTELPIAGNFYLEMFLTGRYRDLATGPLWLRPALHGRLRERLGALTVVTDELERHLTQVGPDRYSKANLSDIFEYMSEDHAAAMYRVLARSLRAGGRIAYWNLLVPRCRPDALAAELRPRPEAATLFAHDRAWFYGSFHVEEVTR